MEPISNNCNLMEDSMDLFHTLIAMGHVAPTRISSQHTDYTSSTTWGFTLPSTPAQGNLMVIVVGGIQSRTVTLPGGWAFQSNMLTLNGSNTHVIGYKIAGVSEGNFNVTFNANLQGAIDYYELSGVDASINYAATFDISVNQSGGGLTSAPSNTFNIPRPSFVITAVLWDDTRQFTTNNGFAQLTSTSRSHTAYRRYTAPASSQQVTWSKVSGADAVSSKVNMIVIPGRLT
jgi:hypothetical protein